MALAALDRDIGVAGDRGQQHLAGRGVDRHDDVHIGPGYRADVSVCVDTADIDVERGLFSVDILGDRLDLMGKDERIDGADLILEVRVDLQDAAQSGLVEDHGLRFFSKQLASRVDVILNRPHLQIDIGPLFDVGKVGCDLEIVGLFRGGDLVGLQITQLLDRRGLQHDDAHVGRADARILVQLIDREDGANEVITSGAKDQRKDQR